MRRNFSLLLFAGACFSVVALEPPSPREPLAAGVDRTPKRDKNSKRTDREDYLEPAIDEARESPVPRRLQLYLQDASEDEGNRPVSSESAYASLLMDDHDRGIRTLGQSLIDSRTGKDLVAILAPGVSHETESRMRVQGWRTRRLAVGDALEGESSEEAMNSSANGSVLAHVSAWALTEYKRVVLLEDNMLVVQNIDDLFECTGICAAMQQAEVVSTALIVLEPNLEVYEHMSRTVGTIYSFSNDFQGFLNSYLAGFETCALFDLENPSLQDPSTDPNRGPDAPLLDHSCHRLPTRYNGDLQLIMLNGGLGMVRTKNTMPEEWWKQRRARVVRFGFAGLRPWMWFASPFLPFVSTWENAHFRAKPSDPMPNMLRVVFVWFSFVSAAVVLRALLLPTTSDGHYWSRRANTFSRVAGGSWSWCLPCLQRSSSVGKRRRSGSSGGYNPRGLLWSIVHLTVGYSSLAFAVLVAVRQVPNASTVWMSWLVFITWTSTIFGVLWSLYLGIISRQAQLSSRPLVIDNGTLDIGPNGRLTTTAAAVDPAVFGAGGVVTVGAGAPPSPWEESVRSLVLFSAVLAFLPAWKPLSGASSLPTLLCPVALALVAMFVGLTVQMVRLPVLWCDRCRFLSLTARDGVYA